MASSRPGFFISVEGIDGSGKSTQTRLLAERLLQEGASVRTVHDPGSTALGERIRGLLLDRSAGTPPAPFTEVSLFLAARVQLLNEVIEPALEQGEVIVCDRYIDSTLVYQGAGRGLDLEGLLELHRLLGADRMPDLTLILDLEVEAARLRADATLPLDRMEAEPTAYHERVRQGYLALASRFPERVVVLSAKPPPKDLAAACWRVTSDRMAARRAT
ncbi:MAG TPA: dTMP kinase [Candidatus Dormibacteraeota bacterium]|nr:dTMP kinase [Candidatus Dormibacteraeota bacterium]